METITSLTNQPRQKFEISLDDNSVVNFNLYYYQSQKAWYFDFEYNGYTSNGNKVVVTPNAIRHLRNKLPFGVGFSTIGEFDPCALDDWTNGNATMILLNSDDVTQTEQLIYDN